MPQAFIFLNFNSSEDHALANANNDIVAGKPRYVLPDTN
jgi:hypothetical protein